MEPGWAQGQLASPKRSCPSSVHHHLSAVPISHPVPLGTGTGKTQIKLSSAANISPKPRRQKWCNQAVSKSNNSSTSRALCKRGCTAALGRGTTTLTATGSTGQLISTGRVSQSLKLPTQAISKQFVLLKNNSYSRAVLLAVQMKFL